MPIIDHFPFEPTAGQREAIEMLENFFEGNNDVFILRGYAGTGKTTLLQGILDYLDSKNRPSALMAYTGRAARIMEQKTKRDALTIHSSIYQLDERLTKVTQKEKKLVFKLRHNWDHPDTVYFIDEASMIPDKVVNKTEGLLFDDGRFLNHIFRYIGPRKVVIIGDDAQLKPFNSKYIPALSADYLELEYKKKVVGCQLTEVMRQSGESSGIIQNATQLRDHILSHKMPPLSLDCDLGSDIVVTPNIWNSMNEYVKLLKRYGEEHAIMITLSNGSAHFLNTYIRNRKYGQVNAPLQEGEWLMVIQNNYYAGYNNGQHLRLKSYKDSGEKVGKISLIDAITEDPDTGKEQKVKIIKDLLFRPGLSLEKDEEQQFIVDFSMRMKKKKIRPKTAAYNVALMNDKRFNALRVKFGYAITCHKAQGGEWDTVFLNPEPVLSKQSLEHQYRWMYTAITRASRRFVVPQHQIIY